MCAHGALQARINPEVKKTVDANMKTAAASTFIPWATKIENNPSVSPSEIWDLRPLSSKEDYIYDGKNYGRREAHYLLEMVGLTVAFNDGKNTTLEMVKEKFREAAQLARELGV